MIKVEKSRRRRTESQPHIVRRVSTYKIFGIFAIISITAFLTNQLFRKESLEFLNNFNARSFHFDPLEQQRLVNLGLPKTGTTSLYREIKDLLNKTSVTHWNDCSAKTIFINKTADICDDYGMCGSIFLKASDVRNRTLLHDFNSEIKAFAQVDCVSSMHFLFPQITLLKRLFQESRGNSIFVLTTRSSLAWLDSVSRWRDLKARIATHLRSNICASYGFRFASSISDDDLLLSFKTWHENRILNLAKSYGERVYILNISRPFEIKENFAKAYRKLTGENVELEHAYAWVNQNNKQKF